MRLQPRFCFLTPHAAPPHWALRRMVRCCHWTPPPHEREHLPQASYADMTQSTGQEMVEHSPSSVRVGQTEPPCLRLVTTERVRVLVVEPQLFLHLDQSPHSETLQWTGHAP